MGKALSLFVGLACFSLTTSLSEQVVQPDAYSQVSDHGRGLRQAGSDDIWDVYVVNDWTSLYNAVIMTQDTNKNVRVVVINHIVGNGKALNFRVHGKLWMSGNCTGIPKLDSPNKEIITDTFKMPYENMCQFFLNEFSKTSSRYSFDKYQDRTSMSGQPFLAVTAPGELRIEDIEFAGCYSLSGGACINMIGGKLRTERAAFAAPYAAGGGGAIYASLSGEGQSPVLHITYTAFSDSKAVQEGDEVYFQGKPARLTTVPADVDKSKWWIVDVDEVETDPDAESPPPPPPPSPSPPPSAPSPPPPPIPGTYFFEDDDSDIDVTKTFFEEHEQLLMIIGAAAGFSFAVCCFMTVVLHILIANRLLCFKDPEQNTLAGRALRSHSRVMERMASMKSMRSMKSFRSSMSFKRTRSNANGRSRLSRFNMSFRRRSDESDDSDDDGWTVPENKELKVKKAKLMSDSTRKLATKLEAVNNNTGQALQYKEDMKARGAEMGALSLTAKPHKGKPVLPGDAKRYAHQGINEFSSGMVPPNAVQGAGEVMLWGPPSLGAVYNALPKPSRGGGPLEQRRQMRENGTHPASRRFCQDIVFGSAGDRHCNIACWH